MVENFQFNQLFLYFMSFFAYYYTKHIVIQMYSMSTVWILQKYDDKRG